MKKQFLFLTLVSLGAQAGDILPNLQKIRNAPNTSPVAIGFASRKAATLDASTTTSKEKDNTGSETSKTTNRDIGGSVFYNYAPASIELSYDQGKSKTKWTNQSNDSSSTTKNYNVGVGLRPVEPLVVGFSYSQNDSVDFSSSSTKSKDRDKVLTPGIGFRLMENLAIGAGTRMHKSDTSYQTAGASAATTYPSLEYNEHFIGVAYGVDQKAAQPGFGAELVYEKSSKEIAGQGTSTEIKKGPTDTIKSEGHYLTDMADIYALVGYISSKDYDGQTKSNATIAALRTEFFVAPQIYLAPTILMVRGKAQVNSTADVKIESFAFGSSVGYRYETIGADLGYAHSETDTKTSLASMDSSSKGNSFNFTLSYYF